MKIWEWGSTSYQKLFFFSKNLVQETNRISSSHGRIGRYMYQSNEFPSVLMGSGHFKSIPLGLGLKQFILLIFIKSNINKPNLPYTYTP